MLKTNATLFYCYSRHIFIENNISHCLDSFISVCRITMFARGVKIRCPLRLHTSTVDRIDTFLTVLKAWCLVLGAYQVDHESNNIYTPFALEVHAFNCNVMFNVYVYF